jgi:hypothetical protein
VVALRAINKKLVFVIDAHGRALSKKSLQALMSELFDKVLNDKNVDVTVANGRFVNNCEYLAGQIAGLNIADWEVVYLPDSKCPPVLLSDNAKEKLTALLQDWSGTSAEAVYKVFMDAGAFKELD